MTAAAASAPFDIVVRDVVLADGRAVDIAVADQVIRSVAPAGTLAGSRTFDGAGGLCSRPLTDAHFHLDKARTAVGSGPGASSLREAIGRMRSIKAKFKGEPQGLTEQMVATLRRLAAHNTRAVRAVVDVDDTWGLTAFQAATAARARVATEIEVRIVAFPQEGLTPTVASLLREAAATGADAIGAHTDIDQDFKSHLTVATEIARSARLPLEVHVDETASPNDVRLPWVLKIAEGVPLTLVHCLSLATVTQAERERLIEAVRSSGAAVVVAPTILAFGLPMAPVADLLDGGVPVVFGSDNVQDVFMPLGTGSVPEGLRLLAVAGGLMGSRHHDVLVTAATNDAFDLVTGEGRELAAGTVATLAVFKSAAAVEILRGNDDVHLTLLRGMVQEGTS